MHANNTTIKQLIIHC